MIGFPQETPDQLRASANIDLGRALDLRHAAPDWIWPIGWILNGMAMALETRASNAQIQAREIEGRPK